MISFSLHNLFRVCFAAICFKSTKACMCIIRWRRANKIYFLRTSLMMFASFAVLLSISQIIWFILFVYTNVGEKGYECNQLALFWGTNWSWISLNCCFPMKMSRNILFCWTQWSVEADSMEIMEPGLVRYLLNMYEGLCVPIYYLLMCNVVYRSQAALKLQEWWSEMCL